MRIKLSFLGASQNVTGSRFLVECDGRRVLVDCGLYQERALRDRNWDRFAAPPKSVDAVCLTHAHLDHCGLLPKLVRDGFRGKIFCTLASAELARIVMTDSAHLQEEDAEYKKRRHARESRKSPRPVRPLYTVADAEKVAPLFSPVTYDQRVEVAKGVSAVFHDAGHVFGSSMVSLTVDSNGEKRTILFSGDVGRKDKPILHDPSCVDGKVDYVVIESTYGDRTHPQTADVRVEFAKVINETVEAGGNVVIPSFAIERSQELLYHLNELLLADRIPHLMVFLDSPMAIRVTEVFRDHPELFDAEMTKRIGQHLSPFDFPGLKMTLSTAESKAINRIRGTAIIVAGSGMCTGGRIKHHLVNNITRPESTILFVGYQAAGTLGRQIQEMPTEVRILGQYLPVRARIAKIGGFSAHADRNELYDCLRCLPADPRHVFVVHGEARAAKAFAQFLTKKTGWETSVPAYKDEVVLD